MENEYNSPVFKKWLDALQQESWQLELIISGFALYGMFRSVEPVSLELKRAVAFENNVEIYFVMFLLVAIYILMLNLTVHVVLRGLWIGAIGLRYISGEIDYEELRLSDRFQRFLKRKVGPFDRFIADLEQYCSVIFAAAFLTVFYILALFIIFAVLYWSSFVITSFANPFWRTTVQIIMLLIFGVGAILTLIDFATLGWLKKNRFTSRIYYPYYRIFSVLTLSFIYRPIIYNLVDNRFGRRLARIMIPTYIVVLLATSVRTVNSNYVPGNFEDPLLRLELFETVASPLNYEDELDDDKFAQFISIPSKTITQNNLPVFIPFSERIEDAIYDKYPEVVPDNDQRGIGSSIIRLESRSVNERREMTRKYLKYFSEVFQLKIDDTAYEGVFVITQNSREQSGFETVIPLNELSDGHHLLELVNTSGDDSPRTVARVPFWVYR